MANIDYSWIGTDGVLSTTTNHRNMADGTTGTLPAVNDRLRIRKGVGTNITSAAGTQTAIDLDLLYYEDGATQNVGAAGAPLIYSADLVNLFGSGTFYFKDGDVTTDLVVCRGPGTFHLDGTSITEIRCYQGNITMAATLAAVTTLTVEHYLSAGDVNLSILDGCGTITTARVEAGRTTCNAVVTTLDLMGGTWIQETQEIVTARVGKGGTLIYNSPASTGTATRIDVWGTLYLNISDNVRTITTLHVHRGGKVIGYTGNALASTTRVWADEDCLLAS